MQTERMQTERNYTGHRPNTADSTEPGPVYVDGVLLDPQCERWHCCELNWGYSGSGPNQLACVLLADALDDDAADALSRQCVDDVIRHLPNAWSLTAADIRDWAATQKRTKFLMMARLMARRRQRQKQEEEIMDDDELLRDLGLKGAGPVSLCIKNAEYLARLADAVAAGDWPVVRNLAANVLQYLSDDIREADGSLPFSGRDRQSRKSGVLRDVRDAFDWRKTDRLPTSALLQELTDKG
jgi:hypothetical protein